MVAASTATGAALGRGVDLAALAQQAAVEFVLLCSGIALAVCWLLRGM